MRDNSPSQRVQEACPSRCTLPYSQRPAALPASLSPLFFFTPPLFKRSVSPLRGKVETGEEQMGSCVGVRRDFQDWDSEGWGEWGRAQVCWKDRTFEQSAMGGAGGVSELETMVIIKVSPFTPCASPLSFGPPSLSTWPTAAHHGAQRKAEARGGKKKKERLVGQDWWQRGRRAALVTHQHILTDSRCPVWQQVI